MSELNKKTTTTKSNTRSDWDVQKLRFTIFAKPSEKIADGDLFWKAFSQFELDKKETNPKTGEQIWLGSNNSQKLTLKIHPIRIDVVLDPKEEFMASPPNINKLGKFDEWVKNFSQVVEHLVTKKNLLP